MKKRHQRTLELLFKRPVSSNVKWKEATALLKALGAEIEEREGSRVAILLDGVVLHQHRPHPSPAMDKGAVADMREFLKRCGYQC
jgi:hypothetical protein